MILNRQANQLIMQDTEHYKNLLDMVLAVINMIIKEDDDRSKTGFVFTNFPNVNMHVLDWTLQDLGYKDGDLETNGWEMDFWETFSERPNGFPSVELSGTGASFEVTLTGVDSDTEDYVPLEERDEYKERVKHGEELLNYYMNKLKEENERVGMLRKEE